MKKHSSLNDQFVTYEIALALKELKFDELCLGYYSNDNDNPTDKNFYLHEYFNTIGLSNTQLQSNKGMEEFVAAPLWQQCEQWFRQKYNIHIEIIAQQEYKRDYYTYVMILTKDSNYKDKDGNTVGRILDRINYDSYEEAREQAILKAIELCKKLNSLLLLI